MEFLEWVEATSLAEWARSSLWGYPLTITAHSIGLAVMVGPVLMLDLRLLGWLKGIPFASLNRILRIAWIGFLVNFVSGVILVTMQATDYVENTLFLIKFSLVVLGAISVFQQQIVISRHAASWSTTGVPGSVTAVAILSLVFWIGAIIVGRQIAYQS